MAINIPTAGVTAGRSASLATPEAGRLGEAVSGLGQSLRGIAEKQAQDRDRRAMSRLRIDAAKATGELRLELGQLTDPDQIADQTGPRFEALKSELTQATPDHLREDAGLAFDAMATPHTLALGERQLKLQKDSRLSLLDEHRAATVEGAGIAPDGDARQAAFVSYSETLQAAVAAGDMSEADAMKDLRGMMADAQTVAAERLLTDDPAKLVEVIDTNEYAGMDPGQRARYRRRATAIVAADQRRATAKAEADQRRAETEAMRLAREADQVNGARLSEITSIARDGRTSADEGLLTDPSIQGHPDYAEAQAAVALRDALPGFAVLTPDDMRAAIAAEKAKPVGRRYETNVLEEMQRTLAASEEAWAEDPISQAVKVGMNAPVAAPDFLTAQPEDLADFLGNRRTYGVSLQQAGYVEKAAFFSIDERKQIAAAVAPDQPVEARARLAFAFASTFGRDLGPDAIAEIGGDALFTHAGGLLAQGGAPEIAESILKGQDVIRSKAAILPPVADRQPIVSDLLGDLIADGSLSPAAERSIRGAADALFAARLRDDPNLDLEDGYLQALQEAMGGTFEDGDLIFGGVQEVLSSVTFLPPGIDADGVEDALTFAAEASDDKDEAKWIAASLGGGGPRLGEAILGTDDLSALSLHSRGGDVFELHVRRYGQDYQVTDSKTGGIFTLNLRTLMEAQK